MATAKTTPPKTVTELGRLILSILKRDDWMTRNDIADALNRRQLTPYDKAQLEYLAGIGLIEVREGKRGAVGKRFEYKAKG